MIYFCMTSSGKLTIHATPWAKQFQDDIEALKEFDEGDGFFHELNEELTNVFLKHVVECCALGFNVLRVR